VYYARVIYPRLFVNIGRAKDSFSCVLLYDYMFFAQIFVEGWFSACIDFNKLVVKGKVGCFEQVD
jgi:hypothetical protein